MQHPKKVFATTAGALLLGSAVLIYHYGFPALAPGANDLSAIVLVGLALTVVFMAILGIIYSVMGVADKTQPLGLPEGSVRALLAFSLLLIFVCLGAFLFSEVNGKACDKCATSVAIVNDAQLLDLKNNNLVVASVPARDENNKLLYEQMADPKTPNTQINDPKHPLYSVSYYPRPSKDAVDFAKQIFTTLGGVFISVVSFYFGSSVTSSAVKAGASAAQGTDGDKKTAVLTNALADSHNAELLRNKADADLKGLPPTASAAQQDEAKKKLDDAEVFLKQKQDKVLLAQQDIKAT